jgi:hypothetical protein
MERRDVVDYRYIISVLSIVPQEISQDYRFLALLATGF